MLAPNGVVLVEIVGRDVITWRATMDPLQVMLRAVDCPDVPMVVALDTKGRIAPVQVRVNGPQTLIQFRKRSPFYVMLYRRRNFLDLHRDYYTYRDSWRFEGERVFAWFFPPGARFSTLAPPALGAGLQQETSGPWATLRTAGITSEAIYQLQPAAPILPNTTPFNLATVLEQMDADDAAVVEGLRQATVALPDFAALLGDAPRLRAALITPPPRAERLWYFAYGANMAAAKLKVRGIAPHASHRASVADWTLNFNHPGVPPDEPVFAGIDPAPGAVVHGVAHAITPAEAAALDRFEGGYKRVPITIQLHEGGTVDGFAYQSLESCPEAVPSARYLGLLLDGARAYHLPAPWIANLEALLPQAPRESLALGARWEQPADSEPTG